MKIQIKTLIFLFAIGLASCGTEEFVGSGTIATEERMISGIDQIDVSGIIEIEIFQSDDFFLEVSGDDNLLNNIMTTSTGSTLKIELEDGNYDNVDLSARIGLPTIVSLDKSGVGNTAMSGFEALEDFRLDHAGTGEVTISGSINNFDLDKSGVGDFHGFELSCTTVQVNQSGIGNTEVSCSDSISGSLSGIGNLSFKGMPSLNVDVSGIGMVIDAN